MSSQTVARIGSQRPAFLTLPADRRASAGQEAIELARLAGLELDDWQQFVITEMLQVDSHGKWSAFEATLICPRQNGKGSILEALQLYGLFIGGDKLQVHTAHEFKTCFEHFLRVSTLIENTPELYELVGKEGIRRGAGDQAIITKLGTRLRFLARSAGSGRGFSGDRVYLDEAFALTSRIMGALLPTLSAVPNPQVVYSSSAPDYTQQTLFELVQRGRSNVSERLLHCEWGNEPGVLPTDRESWARANPALGIRIDERFIEAELEAMSAYPEEFLRERLGVIITQETSGILPLGKWRDCADPGSVIASGHASLAVGPGMAWAALGYCGRRDDLIHVEVARHEAGTAWVVDACRKAFDDTKQPIVVDAKSPTAGVLPHLAAAGIPWREVAPGDMVKACAALQDDLMNLRLRHLDQPPLNAAVAAADVRTAGESWVFSARASTVDITPLLAITLGAHVAREAVTDDAPGGFVDLSDYLDDD
jgi:hypothetical protein